MAELKYKNNYYTNEIIKIRNRINKYTNIIKKYDLIYLYASPVVSDDNYSEYNAPISYMEEIRHIMNIMENSGKKFNCKFECADDEALRDVLKNYRTKILHISAHGKYDNQKYSLVLENLNDKGKSLDINSDQLKIILLNANKINLGEIDLVIVSTCYSEDFADLFIKFGVKNVIYIKKFTEVVDRISVIFTNLFYKNLIEERKTIEDSYKDSIKALNNNPKARNINYTSTCIIHYHYENEHRDEYFFPQKCDCNLEKPNLHKTGCEYLSKLINKIPGIIQSEKKYKEISQERKEICCCDLSFEHDEIKKIFYEAQNDESDYKNISSFLFNEKGKIYTNSNIKLYFDQNKALSVYGRRSLIGRVFNSIYNKEKYFIFFGEKGMAKLDFAETLCVYLYERKIIDNYTILRINTKEDLNELKGTIKKEIENNKTNFNKKKNIKVVKFDNEQRETNFKNYKAIYWNYLNNIFYIIFIFDMEDNEDWIEYKKALKEKLDLKNDNNLFYAGVNKCFLEDIMKKILEDKGIELSREEKEEWKQNA